MREARRWDPDADGMGSSPRGRARRRAALVAYLQMAPAAEVIDACRRCEDWGAEEKDGGAESSSSPSSPSPFGEAAQDALHRCVTHPIATSHPPDREYVARLLKLATLEAERSGRELSDRVGDLVTRTFTHRCDGADGAGWCHKTYVYRHPTSDADPRPDRDDDVNDVNDDDDDDIRDAPSVSFRMHRNMFEGGTGCHEWLAGIYLAELALTHPTLFENRRVVELGSGCGVAATVMARGVPSGCRATGRPSRLVLTDADASALANLERNLAANDVRVERYSYESNDDDESNDDELNELSNDDDESNDDVRDCWSVRTARLNWEDLDAGDFFASRRKVDLVVASDVLYDPLNVTPLLNACERLLGDRESAPSGTCIPGDGESAPRPWHEEAAKRKRAVFVTTLRQPETLALFERVAAARGFAPRDVTAEVFRAIGATGMFESVRGLDRREMRVHELRPPRVGEGERGGATGRVEP